MLILSRKPGQEVLVGDDIVIAVLGIKGNQVRIGFKAPRHINIRRSELAEKIDTPKDETP